MEIAERVRVRRSEENSLRCEKIREAEERQAI
jgi:hypothetical protein